MRRTLKITFPLFLLMLLSASARAEPTVITGGTAGTSVFLGQFRGAAVNVTADGLEFRTIIQDISRPRATTLCITVRCLPGTVVSGSSVIDLSVNFESASYAIIDGVRYNPINTSGSGFTFTAGEVVIPEVSLDRITLSTPFTMTGTIHVLTRPGLVLTYSSDVIGQGTALLSFSRSGDGYMITSITYRFEPGAAVPAPEPATLLLLGTGLAGVAARVRRRVRRRGKVVTES